MAYAQKDSESDVSVFQNAAGMFVCGVCSIRSKVIYRTLFPWKMMEHLREHTVAGDRVPARVFDDLRKECERRERRPA